MEMGWLLSTSLVSGNTAVLERRGADTQLCQRTHKIMPASLSLPLLSLFCSPSQLHVCLFPTHHLCSVFLHLSSTWCPASPCPRTCPQHHPPTYLRHPLRPQHPSHQWLPCLRCHQYWAEQTSPVWEPCADVTLTNIPCLCRQVRPTTQHCMYNRYTTSYSICQSVHSV